MILALRTRHRRLTNILVVFLPIAFLTSLVVRQPAPMMTNLPPAIWPAPSATDGILWDRDNLWPDGGPRVRLLRSATGSHWLIVEFSRGVTPPQPDVLAYWTPSGTNGTGALATNAVLLGSIGTASPQTFAWPESAPESGGRLVLYSLANRQAITTSRPLPDLRPQKEKPNP